MRVVNQEGFIYKVLNRGSLEYYERIKWAWKAHLTRCWWYKDKSRPMVSTQQTYMQGKYQSKWRILCSKKMDAWNNISPYENSDWLLGYWSETSTNREESYEAQRRVKNKSNPFKGESW